MANNSTKSLPSTTRCHCYPHISTFLPLKCPPTNHTIHTTHPPFDKDNNNYIACARVYSNLLKIQIAIKLPVYPNILTTKVYALLLAVEHTKTLNTNIFIFTDNVNSIYLLFNHVKHPSSLYNHPNKLFIAHILVAIKTAKFNIIIRRVRAITNMMSNDEAYKTWRLLEPSYWWGASYACLFPRIHLHIRVLNLKARAFY